jgi:hypothetical protein
MLKLTASYGKKLPVEGLDYSSHNYHASVEVELPDGLDRAELDRRIHDTFSLVRESVDAELHAETRSTPAIGPIAPQQQRPSGNPNQFQPQRRRNAQPASAKQLNYLHDIAARKGMTAEELDQLASTQFGAQGVANLTRDQASRLIDWLGSANTGQAA